MVWSEWIDAQPDSNHLGKIRQNSLSNLAQEPPTATPSPAPSCQLFSVVVLVLGVGVVCSSSSSRSSSMGVVVVVVVVVAQEELQVVDDLRDNCVHVAGSGGPQQRIRGLLQRIINIASRVESAENAGHVISTTE